MATDRVDLVRQGFEAWNSEDPQWVLEHMSPEVEWIAPERDPFPGTYRGLVVVAHRWARNEITGLQIADKIAQVYTFDEDDRCVRVQEFYDRGAALRVAGLE